MDCPAILGSKGDQMWKYMVQWMVQLSKVVRGTNCGSIQCNGWSSLQGGPNVAVVNAMDNPAIKGSKEDQMW